MRRSKEGKTWNKRGRLELDCQSVWGQDTACLNIFNMSIMACHLVLIHWIYVLKVWIYEIKPYQFQYIEWNFACMESNLTSSRCYITLHGCCCKIIFSHHEEREMIDKDDEDWMLKDNKKVMDVSKVQRLTSKTGTGRESKREGKRERAMQREREREQCRGKY